MKHLTSITTIALAIALLAPIFVQPIATAETDASFSVIWITDTQYLSENNPTYFDNLCQWIVENKDNYNVQMVVHTGDLVNDEGNRTQWLNANQSMGILLDNGVPYCWDAGNHDYNSTYWIGDQFTAFNPQVMQAKQYWVGDKFDGMNTAVRFSVSGWDCLIVNAAFEANDSVLTWANSILDSNPQSHAIVATHAYLNKAGKYGSWATDFKSAVLDNHANVFLTLSGHYYPTPGNRVKVGERDELLFNQQDAYDQMGAASARILTFDTAQGTIKVQTYNLYSNQFTEDAANSFTLNTSFGNTAVGNGFPTVFVVVVLVVAFSSVILCFTFLRKKARIKQLTVVN